MTLRARFTDKVWLCASEPVLSVWPTTLARSSGCWLSERATLSSTGSSAGLRAVLSVSNDTLLGMLTFRLPSGISTTSMPSEVAPDCCTSSFTTFQL